MIKSRKSRRTRKRSKTGGFFKKDVKLSDGAKKVEDGMNKAAEKIKSGFGQVFGRMKKGIDDAPGSLNNLKNTVKGIGVKTKDATLKRADSVKKDSQELFTRAMNKIDGVKNAVTEKGKGKKTRGGRKFRGTRRRPKH